MAFVARTFLRLVCALGCLPAAAAPAVEPSGQIVQAKVVAFASASTFAVLDEAQKLRRVKLTGVDAPVQGQRYFEQARQLASEYLRTSSVSLAVDAIGEDARIHARVVVDGHDLGLVLLEAGLAWCDPSDRGRLPTAVQATYGQACEQARGERRGLWRDAHAVPPWEFRRIPQFDPPPRAAAGKHCREIGHQTLQCDDGNRYRSTGNGHGGSAERVVGSDGTIYSRRGNTIRGSDGNRYEIQGRSVYGTDGMVCRQRGRSVDCF